VTLADESTRRFHAKQMRLRSTQLADNDFTAFSEAFNLPVRNPRVANGETEHLDEYAQYHNQPSNNQGIPAADDVKPEQLKTDCRDPADLNEITFQRSNLSWPQEGKRTSTHKLIPAYKFISFFLKWEVLRLSPVITFPAVPCSFR
jgi:hypothetical protein